MRRGKQEENGRAEARVQDTPKNGKVSRVSVRKVKEEEGERGDGGAGEKLYEGERKMRLQNNNEGT